MSQRKLIKETSNVEFSNVQAVKTVEHTANTARSNVNVKVNQASTVQVNAPAPRQVQYEYHDRPIVVKAGPHLKDPS